MQLLKLFKELTVRPTNAEELKGLILQLALDGEFTKQIKTSEFELGDLLEFTKNGFTGRPNDDGIGLLRFGIECVTQSNGLRIDTSMAKYREINDSKKAKYFAKSGDVFVCRQNGNLHFVGKAAYYVGENDRFIFSDSLIQLRPIFNKVNSEFLTLSLSGLRARVQIENYSSTTAGNYSVNGTNLKKVVLKIPPLQEQENIIQIVNDLFKEVEELEEKTKERIQLKEDFVASALHQLTSGDTANQWTYLQEHFKTFFTEKSSVQKLRESILQLAVQGKLTKHWREQNQDVEPASVLLEKIKAEKAQLVKEKKIKKEKPLPPITEDEIPYELPEGWVWCRLRDVGITQTGNTPPKKNLDYFGDFIPFISPADISNQEMKYPREGLSEEGLKVGRLIPQNSLMMVCIGGSIGKCNINEIDVSCNQQINTITPIQVLSEYFRTSCQAEFFQRAVSDKSTGSATPIINKGKWESLVIPLPPLSEQKAIVNIVNQLMNLCDSLESEIEQQTTQIEELMRSCLEEVVKN